MNFLNCLFLRRAATASASSSSVLIFSFFSCGPHILVQSIGMVRGGRIIGKKFSFVLGLW